MKRGFLPELLRRWNSRSTAENPAHLGAVSGRVDDSPGWGGLTGRPSAGGHDYDPGRVQELYADALTAWRRNPIAWRIIAITTDYVAGDSLQISSPHPALRRFINRFWHHPSNRLDLRLEAMSDELARSGDLFVLLFRNPADGLSYLRFVTKDRIARIETADNDWENELAYEELPLPGEAPRRWLSPRHPDSAAAPAVMLHYAVNRPLGALLGESDLTSLLPWLQRYSRMLEDRVRLHWAVRAFLWTVTVPSNRVQDKLAQYRTPPEAGSLIVKDEAERWEAVAPNLNAADARHDLQAVRGMIDAGSGYPPHWRGEPENTNLATASAMQAPTERHLRRRQQYFTFLLEDILYQAYQRAVEIGRARQLANDDYAQLFSADLPDISRSDNESLARSARDLAEALGALSARLPGPSRRLDGLVLRMLFKFAGEPQSEQAIQDILNKTHKPGDNRLEGEACLNPNPAEVA
jgi:hypothetical protein